MQKDPFDQAVETSYWEIFNYCSMKLNYDRDAALECTQKVFETMYRSKSKLKDLTHIRAWLFRTADNMLLKQVREKKAARDRLVSLPEQEEEGRQLPGEEFNYDSLISDQEIQQYKEKLIGGLSENEVWLYELRYEQKIPIHNIAKIMGLSEEAVRKRLSRLKKTIILMVRKMFE